MNIVLIGYRGSGKSSIGRKLAGNLWMEFVDVDALIEKQAGKTIAAIFREEGESGFRNRETAAIAEAAGRENHVIAAGGGAVLRPENVAAMKKHGRVIWLRAEPETLHQRIEADAARGLTRPSLTAASGLEEVRAVLAERTPLYEAAADLTLEVTNLSVDEAARRLVLLI